MEKILCPSQDVSALKEKVIAYLRKKQAAHEMVFSDIELWERFDACIDDIGKVLEELERVGSIGKRR